MGRLREHSRVLISCYQASEQKPQGPAEKGRIQGALGNRYQGKVRGDFRLSADVHHNNCYSQRAFNPGKLLWPSG